MIPIECCRLKWKLQQRNRIDAAMENTVRSMEKITWKTGWISGRKCRRAREALNEALEQAQQGSLVLQLQSMMNGGDIQGAHDDRPYGFAGTHK